MEIIEYLGEFYKKEDANNLTEIHKKAHQTGYRILININGTSSVIIYPYDENECNLFMEEINTYLQQFPQVFEKFKYCASVEMGNRYIQGSYKYNIYYKLEEQDILNLNEFVKNMLSEYNYCNFDRILHEKRDKTHEYTNEEFNNLCFEIFGFTYN